MKQPVDISVIVVSYNTRELLRTCLSTLFAQDLGTFTMETIVVDNGSSDGSAEAVSREFPGATLIRLKENHGFAAANNIGIRRSRGRYVLLLNSDTEVPDTAIRDMLTFMESHPADIATAKLVLPDGRMDPACHRGFPTPWAGLTYYAGLEKLFPRSRAFGGYHLGYLGDGTVHEIDCPSGAFFLVRRSVIDSVGLMDEAYFMYAEDIDWAFRMKQAGFKIFFNPRVTVLHHKKQSGRANVSRERRMRTERMFHENNLRFYLKHYQRKYPFWVTWLIKLVYKIRLLTIEGA